MRPFVEIPTYFIEPTYLNLDKQEWVDPRLNPYNRNLILFIVKTRLYPNHHAFLHIDKLL